MRSTLDYTPPTTLQTLQFTSETLNVIAISLLATCTLANIGSLTSKLLQLTPSNTFTYRGWRRALIFAASDDPLRILSWLCRRYPYSDPSWTRSKSRLRPSRLFVPLCARLFLVLTSIGLIALSIPAITYTTSCQSVDYAPVWNISRVASMPMPPVTCIPIPLRSSIGAVLSVAEHCFGLAGGVPDIPVEQGQTLVLISKVERFGQMYAMFYNSTAAWSISYYLQWRRLNDSVVAYASDVRNLDVAAQINVTLAAIQSVRPECVAGPVVNDSAEDVYVAFTTLSCELSLGFTGLDDFKVEPYLRQVIAYYITGIEWQKFDSTQKRIRVQDSGRPFEESYECPVLVAINKPVLNIVPLTIILVVSIVANLVVTWATRGHGNALDSGYHIVKESLGYDTTTNPLEENADCEKVTAIEIGRWRCTTGGEGHVGFIGRQGDVPVDEFDESTVVAQCVRAEMELEEAQRLRSKSKDAV